MQHLAEPIVEKRIAAAMPAFSWRWRPDKRGCRFGASVLL